MEHPDLFCTLLPLGTKETHVTWKAKSANEQANLNTLETKSTPEINMDKCINNEFHELLRPGFLEHCRTRVFWDQNHSLFVGETDAPSNTPKASDATKTPPSSEQPTKVSSQLWLCWQSLLPFWLAGLLHGWMAVWVIQTPVDEITYSKRLSRLQQCQP